MWNDIFQPAIITVLVVLEVAVWQVRVALATRGRKRIAAALGAVNAVLSVVAIGQVVTNLDRPSNIAGYALGVAVGVYVGVIVDARFAGDPVEYRLVLPGDDDETAAALRARGWPVTMHPAHDHEGPATVLTVVVRANRAARVERDLEALIPNGFHTSTRLRSATWMTQPPAPIAFAAGAPHWRGQDERPPGAAPLDAAVGGTVECLTEERQPALQTR
jgi:uncharacterized protein YebE (UPF0316 family)